MSAAAGGSGPGADFAARNALNPNIAVLSSPAADRDVQRNGLSFCELLQPFATSKVTVKVSKFFLIFLATSRPFLRSLEGRWNCQRTGISRYYRFFDNQNLKLISPANIAVDRWVDDLPTFRPIQVAIYNFLKFISGPEWPDDQFLAEPGLSGPHQRWESAQSHRPTLCFARGECLQKLQLPPSAL